MASPVDVTTMQLLSGSSFFQLLEISDVSELADFNVLVSNRAEKFKFGILFHHWLLIN